MKNKLLLAALFASTNIFGQLPGNGMTDFDGNIYNSVILDTQEWVKENLNVAHYNDGTVIPQVTVRVVQVLRRRNHLLKIIRVGHQLISIPITAVLH